MAILVCRVAWMPGYQSDAEPAGGTYADRGDVPHESRNFLPVGDTYYGFVQNRGHNITIKNLDAQGGAESVADVSVVFRAPDPLTSDLLVTGRYSDATVYRQPIGRPEQDPLNRHVYFTATNATLIGEAERCFRIPRAQDQPRPPSGGVGQHHL